MRNVFSQSQKVCVNNYDTTGLFTQKHLDLKEFKKRNLKLFVLIDGEKEGLDKETIGRQT